MRAEAEKYSEDPKDLAMLWIGIVLGPLAWMASQQVGYLLSTLKCSYGKLLYLSPFMLIPVFVAAIAMAVSFRNIRRTAGTDRDSVSRSRGYFMAIIGLLFSGLSFLGTIAEWLPVFFYRNCQR